MISCGHALPKKETKTSGLRYFKNFRHPLLCDHSSAAPVLPIDGLGPNCFRACPQKLSRMVLLTSVFCILWLEYTPNTQFSIIDSETDTNWFKISYLPWISQFHKVVLHMYVNKINKYIYIYIYSFIYLFIHVSVCVCVRLYVPYFAR